jgi:membrane-associated protein
MSYRRFFAYNVIGAAVWVVSLVTAGYLFAGLEVVQKRFHLVIFGIIFLSVLPAIIEIARELLRSRKAAAKAAATPAD